MVKTKSGNGESSRQSSAPCDTDPCTWLFLNPAGASTTGTTFGVLRKTYGGRTNSALEFGYRKAHPTCKTSPSDLQAWNPSAEKVEVILPQEADDALSDAPTLLFQMDRFAAKNEKSLLVYLTLPLSDVQRVHVGWERARSFASRIANERQLATVLTLHAPSAINRPLPLHAHCLIVPRRISNSGVRFGLYDDELIRDSGQNVLEQLWKQNLIMGG